jgi:pimeloyl-ACP methyl ester carboxylesterase
VLDLPDALCRPDAQLDGLRDTGRTRVTGPEGARIHWTEWGQGPVMVMLHGAYGSWPHFVRNIAAFARDHRVLIPDIPGYGRSDMPAGLPSMVGIGRQIAAGLDALIGADTRYRLVGFSFGGGVAGRLMADHRGRQSHVLLAAPAGIASAHVPPMKSIRGRAGEDLAAAIAFNLRSIMFARDETLGPQAMRIQHECASVAQLRVEKVDWGPGLGAAVPGFGGHLMAVWGDADSFTKPGEVPDRPAQIRAWNPAAETHVLPATGHWLQYENAEAFNTLLRDLLCR